MSCYFYEFYDPQKTYLKQDGTVYTKEKMIEDFPAVQYDKLVVRVFDRLLVSASPLSYYRMFYDISDTFSDDLIIGIITNGEEKRLSESKPMERIAAALEFLELVNM